MVIAVIDNGYWTLPADTPVLGSGEYTITVLHPPFPTSTGRAKVAELAPHDPVRARRFAESFGTVEAVLEELPPTDTVAASPWTRADLDIIRVGCWGNVIGISDPALVDNGIDCPLLEQTEALAKRYPDARIIGSVDNDMGMTHVEAAIHLPGGPALHYSGWDIDQCELTGDPHEVLRALGVAAESLVGQYAELNDEDPSDVDWRSFGNLALGPCDPWHFRTVECSAFRVRHTEGATALMEEIWRFVD
nr:hypothetical protein [uncultured bacterium]